ncbi:hypothetical protein ACFVYT_37795 [Streptomyces sp. NPDC058290]|uniref:hypothetical protein n=1 Tax=Streptomyces sp. NPDC058290 TaxID=3346426 RepID=UPI0036E16B02
MAAAALLLGAAGAFALLDPDFGGDGYDEEAADPAGAVAGEPTAVPTPARSVSAPGYTAVHTGTELVSPDQSYEFDVRAGRVVPRETVSWYVGRSATEFYVPESSDAYITQDGRRGLADCLKGIESQPVTELHFATLRAGRTFCLRAQDGRDVGIVTILTAGPGDGPVKVSVDYYRRNG